MLENKQGGNSNEAERIAVLKACLKLLYHRSVALTADREFIGTTWVKFLFSSQIDFYIRLRSNTLVEKDGQTRRAADWLGERKRCLLDGVKIHGHWVSLAIKRQAKPNDECLIVMSNTFAHCALENYQRRWSIADAARKHSSIVSNNGASVWKTLIWMKQNACESSLLW